MSNVICYPIPFSNELYIDRLVANDLYDICIANVFGQVVFQKKMKADDNKIIKLELSEMPKKSVYILNIRNEQNQTYKFKIVN